MPILSKRHWDERRFKGPCFDLNLRLEVLHLAENFNSGFLPLIIPKYSLLVHSEQKLVDKWESNYGYELDF